MYRFINFSGVTNNFFKFIWKSNAPPKSKIHMWLIMHGKLNTIEFLKGKNGFDETEKSNDSVSDENINSVHEKTENNF